MKPELIIHNSVSLDGSLTGFMPDMELHYRIAGEYKPDAHLIGTDTIITGNEMFSTGIPPEEPADFFDPQRSAEYPWWVIVDSAGRLKGTLHTCRRFEFCRDVIILVSAATPSEYIDHLRERNYRFVLTGKDKVDLEAAFDQLSEKFRVRKILTDTGKILGNLLINRGLVNEISLLIHPLIVGEKSYPMFADIKQEVVLNLVKSEHFENGCVHNVYQISASKVLP